MEERDKSKARFTSTNFVIRKKEKTNREENHAKKKEDAGDPDTRR